jgi:hypothetical protein
MSDYVPLLQDEAEAKRVDDINEETSSSPKRSLGWGDIKRTPTYERFIRYSFVILAICAIVDSALLVVVLARVFRASNVWMATTQNPALTQDFIDALPSKSSYINFDKLYGPHGFRKSTPRPSVINVARAFGHVSSAEPQKTFSQWTDLWLTKNGYIPLDDRKLLVTAEISTIVQFRVLDWGMENCTIIFDIPISDTSGSSSESHWARSSRKEADLPSRIGTRLLLHELEAPHKLDFTRLTYSNKPRRVREIAQIDIHRGHKLELPSFQCTSGTYFTVEVSCAPEDAEECALEYLAVNRHVSGMYIYQRQTI